MNSETQENFCIKCPVKFAGVFLNETFENIKNQFDNGVRSITFDFKNVDFIDSAAIGMLIMLLKEYGTKGLIIHLENLQNHIAQLFTNSGLDRVFDIGTQSSYPQVKKRGDLFDHAVDIRLEIKKEIVDMVCIFNMSGVMSHPVGSRFFKQQLLLSLANYKKFLLDLSDLTFFDSLSISTVFSLNRLLSDTGASMRICGANCIVRDLFSTLNIGALIPLFESRDLALSQWS